MQGSTIMMMVVLMMAIMMRVMIVVMMIYLYDSDDGPIKDDTITGRSIKLVVV